MRQIEDHTADELKDLPYHEILRLRADAFRRHVAKMTVPETLVSWAAVMAKRYGPKVRVWQNTVPWLEALMIVRYGEDPMQWPPAFSAEDQARAVAWAKGKRFEKQKGSLPFGVEYLDASELGFMSIGLAVVLAGLGLLHGWAAAVLAVFGLGVLASALSNFWENELIDHLFRARGYTAPTDHYIALYTAAPGETGGGTEASGGSYARVQVAAGFANWEGTNGETTNVDSAGTGGATQNRNAITFPAPTGNWGSVTHFASLDASSSGNFYFYGALTTPKTVNNGDPAPAFAAGALDFVLA
jgi:hypothetical protein